MHFPELIFFKYLFLTGVWRNSGFIYTFIFTSQHLVVFALNMILTYQTP